MWTPSGMITIRAVPTNTPAPNTVIRLIVGLDIVHAIGSAAKPTEATNIATDIVRSDVNDASIVATAETRLPAAPQDPSVVAASRNVTDFF